MKVYGYFRSSAAYRVRIALNLKGLTPETVYVHLRRKDHHSDWFDALNPQHLVPTLVTETGAALSQSLAIIEYLDETHPDPPLLPADPLGRARVRQIAQIVACDIHPLNNLRVLGYLTGPLGQSEDARDAWYRHWVALGFRAIEKLLDDPATGPFCHGDSPGLADLCLVPQVFNARRFQVDMTPYPGIAAVDARLNALPAFDKAKPENQPDAE